LDTNTVRRDAWERRLRYDRSLSRLRRAAALDLARLMRADGRLCVPRKRICAAMVLSESSVERLLRWLVADGWLVQSKRGYEGQTAEYLASIPQSQRAAEAVPSQATEPAECDGLSEGREGVTPRRAPSPSLLTPQVDTSGLLGVTTSAAAPAALSRGAVDSASRSGPARSEARTGQAFPQADPLPSAPAWSDVETAGEVRA
jgi:hypothetical protein